MGFSVYTKLVRHAVAAGSLLALVALAACSAQGPSASSQAASSDVVEYHMDYPAYDTSDSLYQKADLVVEASVGTATRVQQLLPAAPPNDPKANPNAGTGNGVSAADGVVVTVFQATVTKVLKGTAKPGQAVEVKQLGGVFKGKTYQEVGATHLKSGTNYLLFLALFPDAPASLLNPTQGQYPLDSSGRPSSLPDNKITIAPADLARLTATK